MSRYNFCIDYRQDKKNSANALSRRSNFMYKNDNTIEENRRILYRLQSSFRLSFEKSKTKVNRLSSKKLKTDKVDDIERVVLQYNVDWQIIIYKAIYITKRRDKLVAIQYTIISRKIYDNKVTQSIIALIVSLLLENLFAIEFRKKLAIFEKVDKIWNNENEVLRHNSKLYILEKLKVDVLRQYYDDFLANYFDIKKILSLIQRKYW